MLAMDEMISVVKVNHTKDDDVYTITSIEGCSWFEQLKTEIDDKGVKSANLITARCPPDLPINICRGDYIIKGVAEGIESMTDLLKYEYYTVMSVNDNRRGGLKHWKVVAQ